MKLGRNLIIIVAVIAVLSVGYYFALKYEPPNEKAESSQSDIIVFEADASSVSKISVTNPSGSYTLVKSDNGWQVLGKDYITLTPSVETYVYYFSKIKASGLIEDDANDLSVYGLSEPQAEIVVTADDREISFTVGAADPTGNYYYFSQKGLTKVYTVPRSTAEAYFRRLNSFRDMTVTSINTDDVCGISVKSDKGVLAVERSTVEDGKNTYVWNIVSLTKVWAKNQKVIENLLTPACTITASDIVEDNPTDLSKYGFNKEVTIKLENKADVRLRIGSANGVNYIYTENSVSVYSVSAESIAFVELAAEDIMN